MSRGSTVVARLLDEYVAGAKIGQAPELGALLARCPEQQRSEFQLMLVGAEALIEHEWRCYVSPKTVEATIAAIHRIRHRKQRLREAEQRLAALTDFTREDPVETLRSALDMPLHLIQEAQAGRRGGHGVANWNRAQFGMSTQSRRMLARQAQSVREQRLEEQAEALLVRYDLLQAPVDLDALAHHLCLVVRDVTLDDGIDGCLVADEDYGAILLNRRIQNRQRRRFTLAHEIAHFVLHRKYRVFREALTELGACDDEGEEQEANIMASMLLLPTSLIDERASASERPSLSRADELVSDFEVSQLAAMRRLVRRSELACALVVTKEGIIQWCVESPHFAHFVPRKRRPNPSTLAAILGNRASSDGVAIDDAMPLPLAAWIEPNGDEDEDARVWEESRCLPSGYIYSLITCI